MTVSDRILGALGFALGAAYVWGATRIETGFIADPLGPQTFPIIIGSLMMVASAFVLFRPDPDPHWPPRAKALEVLGAVIILIGYGMALDVVGFVIATAVVAALLGWRLGSRPPWAAVSGIGISVGIYAIFHVVLGLSLVKGPLGF